MSHDAKFALKKSGGSIIITTLLRTLGSRYFKPTARYAELAKSGIAIHGIVMKHQRGHSQWCSARDLICVEKSDVQSCALVMNLEGFVHVGESMGPAKAAGRPETPPASEATNSTSISRMAPSRTVSMTNPYAAKSPDKPGSPLLRISRIGIRCRKSRSNLTREMIQCWILRLLPPRIGQLRKVILNDNAR